LAKKTDKTHKLRGSREHGRGMKKGRGAGLRGGKGQAGWKHKKLHFLLYDTDRIRGKHGFTRHAQDTEPESALTVQHLDERVGHWADEGKAARADNGFTIDLGPLGFDKLVGTGHVTRKLQVTVARASAGAVQKIQAAGGNVTQTNPPPPPAPPKGSKPGGGAGGAPGGGAPGGGKPKDKAAKAEGKPAKGEGKPAAAEGRKQQK
jgi:large subunit ribosomal protein L15